ncbi:MAG: hypothetical protein JWM88_1389 [Verrucomicrobia bacterium]|nr:hypothetical protein [Verrucomicrobiota bacterium]
MSLTPEQKQAVASWVAAGDNLSAVQKKLIEQFKLSMTYRDVRFLVDDLNLALKDAAPKVDASDVTKGVPAKPAAERAPVPGAADAAGVAGDDLADEGVPEELPGDLPGGASTVRVDVDKVTLIPGALASGSVTFSDGVTGQWIVDNQGRPGFTKISQPGYRPSAADSQAFVQELSAALQKRGY